MRHVLLTGFEPFDNDTANPSGEVAKLMARAVEIALRSVVGAR